MSKLLFMFYMLKELQIELEYHRITSQPCSNLGKLEASDGLRYSIFPLSDLDCSCREVEFFSTKDLIHHS